MPATTVLITGTTNEEVQKKSKSLQAIANLSLLEIQRLEEMAKSKKARVMLNENWTMLKSFI